MDAEVAARLKPWFPDLDITKVRIVGNGPVCWFVRHVLKQGAMTIAPFVFFGRDEFDPKSGSSLALVAHELKHIEQYRQMGHVKFLWTYLKDRRRAGGYSRSLPLEIEPYALQRIVRAALSEAVEEQAGER
jgi:hypothetical protein